MPAVLWCRWLGNRKGIRPVKNEVVGCRRGYQPWARCRLAYCQLMPLPLTVSCFSKIQIGFTFLVPAHLGSPGQRAVKRVCVCVCLLSLCAVWTWTRLSRAFSISRPCSATPSITTRRPTGKDARANWSLVAGGNRCHSLGLSHRLSVSRHSPLAPSIRWYLQLID